MRMYAVRALAIAEVDGIRAQFEALNSWRDTLKAPFLKLEKENFAPDGERRRRLAAKDTTEMDRRFTALDF